MSDSGIIYTPTARPLTPTQDCTWQGGHDPPAPLIPSSTKSAEQTAPTSSNPIGKITSADIASISSWKPKFTVEQLLSPSTSQPASQESNLSEGITNKNKKPRISHATSFEPKLETILQSPPAPPASKNEAAPSEDTLLIPITPPTHVKHVHTSPPTLSQILDKESPHQLHAIKHATHNDPISNPKSDHTPDTSDTFIPPNTILRLLQGQQTLIRTITKMETEIASLKEDNKNLQHFIHKELLSGLNQLAKIVTDKNQVTDQAIKNISNTNSKEFELMHKNNLVINDNIKNIVKGNQSITNDIDSLKEKLSSTTVEQKLDKLEKTIEDLQLLKSDTPMDITPTPHPNIPLPPSTSSPKPSPSSHHRQSTRLSYASITRSKIQYQSTTWQDTPVKPTQAAPALLQNRNTRDIRFPQGNRFNGHRLTPQQVVLRVNQIHSHLPFKAILAKWTLKNNLTITFSKESLDKDIDDAAQSIKQCLFPDNIHAIFSNAVNWSKIVFKNTPCRSYSINPEDNSIVAQDLSPNALVEAVRESHPLLEKATFVLTPEWTVKDLPEDASHHNLSFSIEDPDGSIANTLINTELIMFASSVRPRLWKDKFVPAPSANIGPPPTPLPY